MRRDGGGRETERLATVSRGAQLLQGKPDLDSKVAGVREAVSITQQDHYVCHKRTLIPRLSSALCRLITHLTAESIALTSFSARSVVMEPCPTNC